MENNNLILTTQFCEFHQVEFTFINSLNDFGLIETVLLEDKQYLPVDQLKKLEKMIHLHYDLDINIEGIEAISHLLQRVDHLNAELKTIKNKLDFYRDL